MTILPTPKYENVKQKQREFRWCWQVPSVERKSEFSQQIFTINCSPQYGMYLRWLWSHAQCPSRTTYTLHVNKISSALISEQMNIVSSSYIN